MKILPIKNINKSIPKLCQYVISLHIVMTSMITLFQTYMKGMAKSKVIKNKLISPRKNAPLAV